MSSLRPCEGCHPRLAAGQRRGEGHLSVRFGDDPFTVTMDGEHVTSRIREAQGGRWGWVEWIEELPQGQAHQASLAAPHLGGIILVHGTDPWDLTSARYHVWHRGAAGGVDHFYTSIRFGEVQVAKGVRPS